MLTVTGEIFVIPGANKRPWSLRKREFWAEISGSSWLIICLSLLVARSASSKPGLWAPPKQATSLPLALTHQDFTLFHMYFD